MHPRKFWLSQLPDPAAVWIVLHLLQLLNAADPSLADLDDTPDHVGAGLMASRHDAWEELCMSKVRWSGVRWSCGEAVGWSCP